MFEIKALASKNGVGEILVYGDIVKESMDRWQEEDVSTIMFQKQVDALADAKEIHVKINSYGGSVDSGTAMGAILNEQKAKGKRIVTKNMGFAGSMASVLLQFGDERIVSAGARTMIHEPLMLTVGNKAAHKKSEEILDQALDALVFFYMKKFKGAEDELRQLLADETTLSDKQALEYGLCDRIEGSADVAAHALGYRFDDLIVPKAYFGKNADSINILEKKGGENGMVYNKEIDAKIKALLDEGKAVAVTPDEKAEGGYVVSEVLEGVLEATEDFLTAEAAHDALGEDVSGENILALLAAAKDAGASFEAVVDAVKNIGQEPQADPALAEKAKAYDAVMDEAKKEAHKNAVRAMGDKYDKERVDKILGVFDYAEILAQSEEWAEAGAEALHMGHGRVSVTPGNTADGGELNPADIF